MKRIFFIIFFTYSIYSFSQNNSSDLSFKNILDNRNIGTNVIKYSKEIGKFQFNQANLLEGAIESYEPNIKDYDKNLKETIGEIKSNSDRDKIILKTVEYGTKIILSPTNKVPYLGNILSEINKFIFDAAESDLKKSYGKKLAYSLEEIRKTNSEKYNEIINSSDYEKVKTALDDVNFFSTQDYGELAPEYQEVITKSQEKFFKESVNTTLKRVLDDIEDQKFEINYINSTISELSKFTYDFAIESNNRLNTLSKAQNELNRELDKFYTEYQGDKKSLNFMQEFLYSKMNTKEKILALNSGLFPNINEVDKKKIEDKLIILEKREAVIDAASKFLNGASISLKIANDLGLGNSPLAKDLSNAINYGNATFNAITSFADGRYLEAISSITGLMKKNGPDIAGQRHKQIMERFDRIDSKLEIIEDKLNTLIQGQNTIIALQQETFNFLIDLANNIDEKHYELMNQFQTVENAIYVNRQLIKEDWQNKCQNCLEIIEKRLFLDIDNEIYPDYNTFRKEYANIKSSILPSCEEYTSSYRFTIGNSQSVNPQFYLSSEIKNIKQSEKINELIKLTSLSFNLLFNSPEFKESEISREKLLLSLFHPSTNIQDLNLKYNSKEIEINDKNYKTDLSLFENLLSPQAISRHGYVIRNIGFLISLINEDNNPIDWDIISSKNIYLKNYNLYTNEAIQLNNISIAQQAILSGDILLPIIYNILENIESDSTLNSVSRQLLSENSIIAENFTNYYFFKKTKGGELNQIQYSFIHSSKDPILMNNYFKPAFPVEYINLNDERLIKYNLNEGWYMLISDLPYQLPDPISLNNIYLRQTESLPLLTDNRNKLYQQLKSYEIYDDLSDEQVNAFNFMLFKTEQ